jgi:hypothetical protein
MFSFLKTGDIHNSIRGLTNLPGLFTSDGDKIKYTILNYSTAMRKNLSDGVPIFAGIRNYKQEEAGGGIEISGNPHSPFSNRSILHVDNAAFAFIMAKEIAFLNRTLQMITLIANRYQEEQDDLNWGRSPMCDDDHDDHDHDHDDVVSPPVEDLEQGYEDDTTSSVLLRSHSHPTNEYGNGRSSSRISNQLAATFLIASGHLIERFNNLCALTGTSVVIVNGMTTMDRPHNEANREKQLTAQSLVISDIFLHFGAGAGAAAAAAQHNTDHPVATAFLELRDISVSAWKIMSMFAFSNLFRLTAGTEFAMQPYQPEDAIFTQGRDYRLQPTVLEHCCVGANRWEAAAEAAAEADADYD